MGLFTDVTQVLNIEDKGDIVFVDKAKNIIVCTGCSGTKKRPYDRADSNYLVSCNFCDGTGTIKLELPQARE